MAKHYETGKRDDVLYLMAQHAIRDQDALIDALTPPKWARISQECAESIAECEKNIRDYIKIMETLNG